MGGTRRNGRGIDGKGCNENELVGLGLEGAKLDGTRPVEGTGLN